MKAADLLRGVVSVLESNRIPYFITGSVASINYGEPRFTNDIDIVVNLSKDKIDNFCNLFPAPEYYISTDAVQQAIEQQFQFNVIHIDSGLKIDFFIPSESKFDQSRISRVTKARIAKEQTAWFASPEDVIIKKLEYFREGGSEKHLRDIMGMLKLLQEQINRDYIHRWVKELGLLLEWERVVQQEQDASE